MLLVRVIGPGKIQNIFHLNFQSICNVILECRLEHRRPYLYLAIFILQVVRIPKRFFVLIIWKIELVLVPQSDLEEVLPVWVRVVPRLRRLRFRRVENTDLLLNLRYILEHMMNITALIPTSWT